MHTKRLINGGAPNISFNIKISIFCSLVREKCIGFSSSSLLHVSFCSPKRRTDKLLLHAMTIRTVLIQLPPVKSCVFQKRTTGYSALDYKSDVFARSHFELLASTKRIVSACSGILAWTV
ncbi:hypothetical protein RvY_00882-3 [Ramazzottius varieornatus]|uniref:Uncharacterized protein n=1 Tax=Ramazzottius varieornatus TaxID=947166 RepID=A0A1D1UHZ7_RAMVA|nr:hypothetical protein RvY_00882-3 [Ramazzottius varieornatus]